MKKVVLWVVLIVLGGFGAFGQAADVPFVYDDAKVEPGTVYFYKVSDKDKGQAYDFIVYQADEKTFLSFGDFSEIAPMVQIGVQKYNPEMFCYEYFMNENPYSYAKKINTQIKTEFSLDIKTKKMSGYLAYINLLKKDAKYTGSIDFLMLPSYEVSGCQLDLAYSMRFLRHGTKEFTVGCYTATKSNIEKVSFINDLKILIKTVTQVFGKGESSEELDVTDDYGDALLKAGKVSAAKYDALQAYANNLVNEHRRK